MGLAALALLHVLVFVYWLGADLGAFYASFVLSDDSQSPAARMSAARILQQVDMAPRTALILALPTGLTLARASGWLEPPAALLALIWAGALSWLALVWRIHLSHGAQLRWWRRLDLAIRWTALAALAALGAAVVLRTLPGPRFIGVKLVLLAAAIGLGLWARALLAPFPRILQGLAAEAPEAEDNDAIAASLGRVRMVIAALWLCLLCAAFLGLWRPA